MVYLGPLSKIENVDTYVEELRKWEHCKQIMIYVVSTKNGYYYTTGNGRYGRFSSMKTSAETLCKKHTDEIVKKISLANVVATLEELEEIADRECMICQRWKRTGSDR